MNPSRFTESMQWLTGPPDPRSESDIDADIADEIAFHLEQAERDERAAGADEQSAPARARERFGNVQRITRQLRFIAMKERIMLQRVHLVLMLLVLLVVAGVSIQVYLTQRHNTLALQELTTRLGQITLEAKAPGVSPGDALILLRGDIDKAGWRTVNLLETPDAASLVKLLGMDNEDMALVSTEDAYPGRRVLVSRMGSKPGDKGNFILHDGMEVRFLSVEANYSDVQSHLLSEEYWYSDQNIGDDRLVMETDLHGSVIRISFGKASGSLPQFGARLLSDGSFTYIPERPQVQGKDWYPNDSIWQVYRDGESIVLSVTLPDGKLGRLAFPEGWDEAFIRAVDGTPIRFVRASTRPDIEEEIAALFAETYEPGG